MWRSHHRTLTQAIEFAGVGLHSGAPVRIRLGPSTAPGGGVVFRHPRHATPIRAGVEAIDTSKSQLCTQLTAADGSWNVSTIEHLMAALTAARVTSADVEILEHEGPRGRPEIVEMPILDGSAMPFAQGIQCTRDRKDTRRFLRVRRPVQVLQQDKAAWLLPMPTISGAETQPTPTLDLTVQVNFAHKGLGTVVSRFVLGHDAEANLRSFEAQVAAARTFTFEDEIAWMRQNGLALGGSLENAVVFKNPASGAEKQHAPATCPPVLNPEGLRFPEDEWARHKLLDCIGDLGLVGMPLHAYFFATSPGHALTHQLVKALLQDEANFEVLEGSPAD